MTYDEFLEIALTFPDVEESLYYGDPAIKRGKRFMFGLKSDGETVSMKIPWDLRDRLLKEQPEIYFITPHFETWPYFLVRFGKLNNAQATELIRECWEDAPIPGKRRR
ncbi:MAG: hypothetical protein ABL962_02415 [Fimbriimonadaceae bacterium]